MNPVNIPDMIGTDINHVFYFIIVFSLTLTLFFLFYDDNPPQPPIP